MCHVGSLAGIACPDPDHMSSSAAAPSLADRLVTACWSHDLPSMKAVVPAGASVNEKGNTPSWDVPVVPLKAAAFSESTVVWLLSHGADPNGDGVMAHCTSWSTATTLQLLIDAGGDISWNCRRVPPLFAAVRGVNSEDKLRVLLAQPSLDLTIKYECRSPEQFARYHDRPALADMIAQEVSCCVAWRCADAVLLLKVWGGAVAGRSRDERRWYDSCLYMTSHTFIAKRA